MPVPRHDAGGIQGERADYTHIRKRWAPRARSQDPCKTHSLRRLQATALRRVHLQPRLALARQAAARSPVRSAAARSTARSAAARSAAARSTARSAARSAAARSSARSAARLALARPAAARPARRALVCA